MHMANGEQAISPADLDELWFRHFAEMEDGIEVSGGQLLDICIEQRDFPLIEVLAF